MEFFDPTDVKESIHIIGCGAIGSTIVELLVRLGFTKLHLYDFDVVTDYNVANQMYRHCDIGNQKLYALSAICTTINPDIEFTLHSKGWVPGTPLNGYVFLCVDNIELRAQIVKEHLYNTNISAMFDYRMRLTDAQAYAANWDNQKQKENFLASMDFTEAEAKTGTPVSACGTTLSVAPTIRMIVSCGVSNFMNCTQDPSKLKKLILADPFNGMLDVM